GADVGAGLAGLVRMSVSRLIGWDVWGLVTYLIGARLMPTAQTRADGGQLLRTLGFASTPGVLAIFAVIPGLGSVVNVVVGIWMLVAMVIAVRQALDYDSTARAVGVVVIGFILYLVVAALAGIVISGLR